MKDNKDLYNKIMEQVAKQVKLSLNEVDDIAPKKQEVIGEVYIVRCDGMNKSSLDSLSKQLPAFDNYGSGSIRVTCKTHEEVIKVITLLVNANILDNDNSLGQSPRISIQKVNKNSVNDSVNEGYIQASKVALMNPRQKAKAELIDKIISGDIERNPESIRTAMDKYGLWNNRSEGQIQMDVNLIMRKTQPEELMEGDFITDFTFSKDSYEVGEYVNGMDAANNHVKWLRKHGMDVKVEEGRYSYKIYIHYSTRRQFNELVQWMAWHCGYTDTVNNPCPKEDREYFENIIKSGKYTTFR